MIRSEYPFKFVASDDLFAEAELHELAAAFPSYQEIAIAGKEHSRIREPGKAELNDISKFPSLFQSLADFCRTPDFMKSLGDSLGVKDLIWDPTMRGAGLHCTKPGGSLGVHTDFNRNGELYRRVNLLIFLNKDWLPEWGGELELWTPDVKSKAFSLLPTLGRVVAFETTDTSFHGVAAVRCPPGLSRNSFSVYYYTKEPPASWDGEDRGTVFKYRPGEWYEKYIGAPWEYLKLKSSRFGRKLCGVIKRR